MMTKFLRTFIRPRLYLIFLTVGLISMARAAPLDIGCVIESQLADEHRLAGAFSNAELSAALSETLAAQFNEASMAPWLFHPQEIEDRPVVEGVLRFRRHFGIIMELYLYFDYNDRQNRTKLRRLKLLPAIPQPLPASPEEWADLFEITFQDQYFDRTEGLREMCRRAPLWRRPDPANRHWQYFPDVGVHVLPIPFQELKGAADTLFEINCVWKTETQLEERVTLYSRGLCAPFVLPGGEDSEASPPPRVGVKHAKFAFVGQDSVPLEESESPPFSFDDLFLTHIFLQDINRAMLSGSTETICSEMLLVEGEQ